MHTSKFVTFLMALLFSGAALAESVVNPGGGNAWNFYAMGNGEAIASILSAIKMMMSPDEGNSGYGTVLLFMAVLGFVVLAAQAGFNPGKHLGRMFGYVLVVWMVMLTTTNIKANVRVYDPVTNYDTVVARVPALVAVPASIISEIGVWMTRKLEDVFTVPTELTLSAGASEGLGGGYNLFGRMMADADTFVITNPELKRSLAAFSTDCVVPAIALGKLAVQKDLMQSTDMMRSLAKAQHPSILTRYYKTGGSEGSCATQPAGSGALGTTMPCDAAYACIASDMETYASAMLTSSSQSWGTSGVMVPYETAMQAALTYAGRAGNTEYANYSRPHGFILQKSMMSSMRGSFRQAAVQTGNNELLMAASIAQAEQAQKSGWWTAAEVFKNLMGYIYTVLQAFLFAIVPVIVIALMIPGLGAKIFVNYAQLLIWLALWMPLLAIINYLIALFGQQDIYSVWSLSGGPTMQTEWTVSEKTNNLVIAAQFLGTSVPILALGLVKGAMAFTEFVSNGIGSSLATQAGAASSSGNLSMGNMSMDQVSANKWNTASSSTVGHQDTMAFLNAGGAQQNMNLAGAAGTGSGGGVNQSNSVGDSLSSKAELANKADINAAGGFRDGAQHKEGSGVDHGDVHSTGRSNELANERGSGRDAAFTHGAGGKATAGETEAMRKGDSVANQTNAGASLKGAVTSALPSGGGAAAGGAGAAPGSPAAAAAAAGAPAASTGSKKGLPGGIKAGGGVHAEGGTQIGALSQTSAEHAAQKGNDQYYGDDAKTGLSSRQGESAKDSWSGGARTDHVRKADKGDSIHHDADNSLTGSTNASYTTGASHTSSADRKWNFNSDVSVEDMMYAANGGMGGYDPRGFEQIQATGAALQQMSAGVRAAAAEERAERAKGIAAEFGRLEKMSYGKDGLRGPVDYSGFVNSYIDNQTAAVDALQGQIHAGAGAIAADAGAAAKGHNPMDINNLDINWKDKSVTSSNSYLADGAVLGAGLLNLAGPALEAAQWGRNYLGSGKGPGGAPTGPGSGGASFMDHAKTAVKAGAYLSAGVHLWDQYSDPSGTDDRMRALYSHWGADAPESMGGYVAGRGVLLAADTLNTLSFGMGRGVLGLDSPPPK